jgi:hypothetical protein
MKEYNLSNLQKLKEEYPVSDKLREACDQLASILENKAIPEDIKDKVYSFINATIENSWSFNEERIKLSNDISKILENKYQKQEHDYEEAAINADGIKECAWICVGVIVTALAFTSGWGLLLTAAVVGLGMAVADMIYKIPAEIHDLNRNNGEYQKLSTLGKCSFVIREACNDPMKLTCAALTLASAVFLMVVLFVPALITTAPITVPVATSIIMAISLVNITKKINECQHKLAIVSAKTEQTHFYTNQILDNISEFNSTLHNAKNEQSIVDKSTKIEPTKEFRESLNDAVVDIREPSSQKLEEATVNRSVVDRSETKTKVHEDEDDDGDGSLTPHM